MTLTKARLIYSINKKTDLSKSCSAKVITALFEIIKINLVSGNDISIKGFGKFSVKNTPRRRGSYSYENDLSLGFKRIVLFKSFVRLFNRINCSI